MNLCILTLRGECNPIHSDELVGISVYSIYAVGFEQVTVDSELGEKQCVSHKPQLVECRNEVVGYFSKQPKI